MAQMAPLDEKTKESTSRQKSYFFFKNDTFYKTVQRIEHFRKSFYLIHNSFVNITLDTVNAFEQCMFV